MGIRIPAQVSKVNNSAATSTQSFRPKSILNALDGQDSDSLDFTGSDDDTEIMALAEEEEGGGGGGNGEEEEEESSQEEDNNVEKDKEDEPLAHNSKIPQKRKNRAGGSGSRST
jgi:hypothetical protein